MCVDNKIKESVGVVISPTCGNEKCVYIPTNKTSIKLTMMLFDGDGTHCLARKTNRDCEKGKLFPFSRKFHRQSQSSTSKPKPKKAKIIRLMA